MTQRFAKAQLRLMKYGAFLGIIGGIALFVGPNHSCLIKALIGIIVGCALLGNRLPKAIKKALSASKEMIESYNDSVQ